MNYASQNLLVNTIRLLKGVHTLFPSSSVPLFLSEWMLGMEGMDLFTCLKMMKENNFCPLLVEILCTLKNASSSSSSKEIEKLEKKIMLQQEAAKWVMKGEVENLRRKLEGKRKKGRNGKEEEEEEKEGEEERVDPNGGVLVGGNSPEGLGVSLFFLSVCMAQTKKTTEQLEIVRLLLREKKRGEERVEGFDVLGFSLGFLSYYLPGIWKESRGEEEEEEEEEEEFLLRLYTILLEGEGKEEGNEKEKEEERRGEGIICIENAGYFFGEEKWPALWMAIKRENEWARKRRRILLKVVELLLSFGADPNDVVRWKGRRGTVKEMVKREVGMLGEGGERVCWESVLVLLEIGAPPFIKG